MKCHLFLLAILQKPIVQQNGIELLCINRNSVKRIMLCALILLDFCCFIFFVNVNDFDFVDGSVGNKNSTLGMVGMGMNFDGKIEDGFDTSLIEIIMFILCIL